MKNNLKIQIFDAVESPLISVFVENTAKMPIQDSVVNVGKIEAAYPYYGQSSTLTSLQGKSRFNCQASADPRQDQRMKMQKKDKPVCNDVQLLMKLKERELKKRILLSRSGKKSSLCELEYRMLQTPV
jgi:hypothetical protein